MTPPPTIPHPTEDRQVPPTYPTEDKHIPHTSRPTAEAPTPPALPLPFLQSRRLLQPVQGPSNHQCHLRNIFPALSHCHPQNIFPAPQSCPTATHKTSSQPPSPVPIPPTKCLASPPPALSHCQPQGYRNPPNFPPKHPRDEVKQGYFKIRVMTRNDVSRLMRVEAC